MIAKLTSKIMDIPINRRYIEYILEDSTIFLTEAMTGLVLATESPPYYLVIDEEEDQIYVLGSIQQGRRSELYDIYRADGNLIPRTKEDLRDIISNPPKVGECIVINNEHEGVDCSPTKISRIERCGIRLGLAILNCADYLSGHNIYGKSHKVLLKDRHWNRLFSGDPNNSYRWS